MTQNLWFLLWTMLGFAIHVFARAASLKEDYKPVADVEFNMKEHYWKPEKYKIVVAFLCSFVPFLAFNELASMWPPLAKAPGIFYFTFGLTGTYFVMRWKSASKKIFREKLEGMASKMSDMADKLI